VYFKNKKGQLEISITMMVLVVFIVLMLLSLILYFRFTYTEIEETREDILDQKYSSLLSTIIGLPEFRCSKNNADEECLDASKLHEFDKLLSDKHLDNYYRNLFGNVNGIWVEIIDSGLANNTKKDYSDAPMSQIYGEKKSKGLIYSAPVSVYYPDYKRYKIGVLKIQGEL